MDRGALYIGMDLGTFKTSVAASTGTRDVTYSAVGWPRDHVARAMLGRDVVFGKDIMEHRLALNIVRPFEKGVLKYNEAALPPDRVEKHKEAARLLVAHANAHRDDEPVWQISTEMFESTLALYQRDQDAAERGLRTG